MSSVIGRNIQYSLFGESHGEAIGMTIHSFPAGIRIDEAAISIALERRLGVNAYSTKRRETESPQWLSGVLDGVTTGAPLTFLLPNKDRRSADYSELKDRIRPSHADYTAKLRYNGFNDYRGGGIFSGRLSAAYVVVGTLAKTILAQRKIDIVSRLVQIGDITIDFNTYNDKQKDFAALDETVQQQVDELINNIIHEKDSLGGKIKTKIFNFPAGIGDPHFYGLEAVLSQYLFAIPALKSLSFGLGNDFASARASEVNDELIYEKEKLRFMSNNNGGILGGISTGDDIVFDCVFKPTPSIAREQQSVNLKSKQNIKLAIKGRHDPAFVLRTAVIVESVTAMALLDILKGKM